MTAAGPAGDTAAATEGTATNQDDDTGGARPKTTVSVYGLQFPKRHFGLHDVTRLLMVIASSTRGTLKQQSLIYDADKQKQALSPCKALTPKPNHRLLSKRHNWDHKIPLQLPCYTHNACRKVLC